MMTIFLPKQTMQFTTSLINNTFTPLYLTDSGACLLDQRKLPSEETWLPITSVNDMADAIQTMVVRGAPAIGVAAAYGLVLSARANAHLPLNDMISQLKKDGNQLAQTRPTAVNLTWAINEILALTVDAQSSAELLSRIPEKAINIHHEDIEACQSMGELGAATILNCLNNHREKGSNGATIMTHCNAGALATGGYGTALGVIRSLRDKDPSISIIASETRPRLQGAKLTAWELARENHPVTVISDNMAASLMRTGKIDAIVVGADRITANGDVANKIGTYSHALAAKAHNIPFYVAAPNSTIDLTLATGDSIPIEERSYNELYEVYGDNYPNNVNFLNPGFDVTPNHLITGIFTEQGMFNPRN
jgi:methylthioribose-1-phosphate isomerase